MSVSIFFFLTVFLLLTVVPKFLQWIDHKTSPWSVSFTLQILFWIMLSRLVEQEEILTTRKLYAIAQSKRTFLRYNSVSFHVNQFVLDQHYSEQQGFYQRSSQKT